MDFDVGDRVRVGGTLTGTVICITTGECYGVQMDDEDFVGHRCSGLKLKAGSIGDKSNCWWVTPDNLSRVEVEDGK